MLTIILYLHVARPRAILRLNPHAASIQIQYFLPARALFDDGLVNQPPRQPARKTGSYLATPTAILAGNRDGAHCCNGLLIHIHSFTSAGFGEEALVLNLVSNRHPSQTPLSALVSPITPVQYGVSRSNMPQMNNRTVRPVPLFL